MFKKILLVLVLVVAVFAVVVAMQPSEFHIARSATIAAPPAAIFPHVNNFHKWEAWSPWAKIDPNAKSSYDGPIVHHSFCKSRLLSLLSAAA